MIHENLKGEWRFDGNFADTSGEGNAGTNTDVTFAAGPTGIPAGSQVGVFNGAAYIEFANPVNDYPFTLAAWVYAAEGASQAIVSLHNANASSIYWKIGVSNVGLAIINARNTTSTRATGTTDIAGAWHHVAGVFVSSTLRILYVDATEEARNETAVAFDTSPEVAVLVGLLRLSSPTYYFDGNIARAQIYNAALSASDVRRVKDGWNPIGRA